MQDGRTERGGKQGALPLRFSDYGADALRPQGRRML